MNAPARIKASVTTLSRYAAASALALVVFYALHYAGNQIPYELAQQRFAATFDTAGNMTGTGIDFSTDLSKPIEYCLSSGMVLAGATGGHAAVDAVLLKHPDMHEQLENIYCGALQSAADGGDIRWVRAKVRYRWGSKALYAIALHVLSVPQFHAIVKTATYGAYLLLAGALLLIGWRALAVAAPVLVLGPFFSGIPFYADALNGIPYLWAVLAAAVLALLLARPNLMKWAPPFCFFAGLVSSYLWMWEGHNFLITVLLGMVAWLGYAHLDTREQTRAATACVALYITGFVVLFALDQTTKFVLYDLILDAANNPLYAFGYDDWFKDSGGVLDTLRAAIQYRLQETMQLHESHAYDHSRYKNMNSIETFFPFLTIASIQFSKALLCASVLALAGAVALARYQARHGWHGFSRGVLWLTALLLAFSVHFLLPDDVYPRSARYAFVPLALGWSCLIYPLLYAEPLREPPQDVPPRPTRKRRRRARLGEEGRA